jgi:hypothetical protein
MAPIEIQGLTRQLQRDLRQGRLTLGQVVGLTRTEVAAVMRQARRLQRRGSWPQARALYGLLLAHQPLERALWRAMGGVQRRLGDPGAAKVCDLALRLLGGAH